MWYNFSYFDSSNCWLNKSILIKINLLADNCLLIGWLLASYIDLQNIQEFFKSMIILINYL